MIIKDVRITLLRAPYKEQPGFQRGYDLPREILAVEIETKSGLVGLGYQLYLRQGFRTTKACLEELLIPRIMGRDATAVEAIWRDLFMSTQADGRGGAPVLGLSVIDVALWDLVGQRAKMPLHRIWGHFRDKVPAYGSGVWRGLGGDGMVEKAKRLTKAGFKAVKMQVGHAWTDAEDVDNVRRVREAVGPDVDVLVALRLLRRDVVRRAHADARLGAVLREPQVAQLGHAVLREQDVVGLHVAVDEALLMGVVERPRGAGPSKTTRVTTGGSIAPASMSRAQAFAGWRSAASISPTISASTALALWLGTWQVPAASCPPPPCASIRRPMSKSEERSMIERPTARTVFCFRRPQSTCTETVQCGCSA